MPKKYQTYTNSGVDVSSNRADDLDRLCLGGVTVDSEALDLGCGLGGQSLRLVKAGAKVTAVDSHDFSSVFSDYKKFDYVNESNLKFIKSDLREISQILVNQIFDTIVIQRTLHYLTHKDAYELLKFLSSVSTGRIYLSVMNMNADSGDGYQEEPDVDLRFFYLSQSNQTKYSIYKPVCLYQQSEIEALIQNTGWQLEKIWQSAFGNIKLVAKSLSHTERG
jgi:cyclopropane fatty-acyl-phospholipid synthase-like methyltransferase